MSSSCCRRRRSADGSSRPAPRPPGPACAPAARRAPRHRGEIQEVLHARAGSPASVVFLRRIARATSASSPPKSSSTAAASAASLTRKCTCCLTSTALAKGHRFSPITARSSQRRVSAMAARRDGHGGSGEAARLRDDALGQFVQHVVADARGRPRGLHDLEAGGVEQAEARSPRSCSPSAVTSNGSP